MFERIVYFVKYNKAVSVGILIVLLGVCVSLAASPGLRGSFFSSTETVTSIDNHAIIYSDLDHFNFNLKINSVKEDNQSYYIGYSYKTLAIEDSIWQAILRDQTLTVPKESLGDKDLGLYVAKELGDNVNQELSYLKDQQNIEKDKGVSEKVITVDYSGLIGNLLTPKEKVIEIPEPAPQEPPQEPPADQPSYLTPYPTPYPTPAASTTPPATPGPTPPSQQALIDEEEIKRIIQELLSEHQPQTPPPGPTTQPPPGTPPSQTPPPTTPPTVPYDYPSPTPDVVPDPSESLPL